MVIRCVSHMGTARTVLLLRILAVVLLLFVSSAGCTGTPPVSTGTLATPSVPASGEKSDGGVFTLHAANVSDSSILPIAYTCAARMPSSPPISWDNVPDGTKTLTLIMEDPDAPSGTFTHWIVFNIPPERMNLPADVGGVKEIGGGGQQGSSSAGERGYYPACPPVGSRHRYIFTLYAVDYTMGLPTADRDSINRMLNDHVIGEVVVTTTFSR